MDENKDIQENTGSCNACWEYWRCSKEIQEKCPVWKAQAGKQCWMYTDNLKVFDWIRPQRHFHSCLECPWYKHLHGQDKNQQPAAEE